MGTASCTEIDKFTSGMTELTTRLIVTDGGTVSVVGPRAIGARTGIIWCFPSIGHSRAWCAKTIAITYVGGHATSATFGLQVARHRSCSYRIVAVVTYLLA